MYEIRMTKTFRKDISLGPGPFMLFCVNYYFFLGSLGNNPYLCNQIN